MVTTSSFKSKNKTQRMVTSRITLLLPSSSTLAAVARWAVARRLRPKRLTLTAGNDVGTETRIDGPNPSELLTTVTLRLDCDEGVLGTTTGVEES